jgi:hypothetical protein
MRRILPVGAMWFLLCAPCAAQTLGTITGQVKDGTGAVLPGVTVTVINQLKEGVMICTGGDSPAADIGRKFSNRTDPW